jgi:hexosaminidase
MNYKFTFFLLFIIYTAMQTPLQAQIKIIPKPQEVRILDGDFIFSDNISLISSGADADLISYMKDYLKELFDFKFVKNDKESRSIRLYLNKEFQNAKPEAYSLKIYPDSITIISSANNGLFYGIQTLFQLLPKNISGTGTIKIKSCEITDYPRFAWRGLNLDCCRHFMTKDFIKRYIDILAYYKFNIFHWHLTEDQGWRIEIKKYPKLTEIGAWRKEPDGSIYGGYYTQEDIKKLSLMPKADITVVLDKSGTSLASLALPNSCTGGLFEVTNMWEL